MVGGQKPEVDEPISIVGYDPMWPSLFEGEQRRVQDLLGDRITGVEHFGSTAVVGMSGKPIIDLLVGVTDLRVAYANVPDLQSIGYENFGEIFIPGRLYLRRRGAQNFNIAMTVEGGEFWRLQLMVRDYLRAHPEEIAAYSKSKRDTFDSGAGLYSTYSKAKAPFLSGLVERATRWSASN